VTVSSGDGIVISAGAADVVVLRGLTLTGQGGDDGIRFNSGAALYVEGLVISGFTGNGVSFAAPGQLFVKDTTVRDNGGHGINVSTGSGASASIENSRFEGQGNCGVFAGGRASIRESVASGNNVGFCVGPDAGEMNVHNSLAADNFSNGIHCFGSGGTARVANSIVTNNNDNGLRQVGSCTLESLRNNLVRGNGTETSGVITVVPGQ
jgi:hypothetical protein